jgi:hypothetical protein
MSKKIVCYRFPKRGKSISQGLPFLRFAGFYDICNWYKLDSSCCFEKLGQFGMLNLGSILIPTIFSCIEMLHDILSFLIPQLQ